MCVRLVCVHGRGLISVSVCAGVTLTLAPPRLPALEKKPLMFNYVDLNRRRRELYGARTHARVNPWKIFAQRSRSFSFRSRALRRRRCRLRMMCFNRMRGQEIEP